MYKLNLILIFIILIFLNSCSKQEKKVLNIKETSQEMEMTTSYKTAYEMLNKNDNFNAAQKFLEAELLFPQSDWAPRSALMASYAYYLQNFYFEAISNLERYLKTYPKDKSIAYAHYLIAICHYEMIEGEKRDSEPLIMAREKFVFVLNNYPNTDFAVDAKFKLDLIQDILASKEMYLGRHYQKKQKWIAAINRYKNVVKDYDQTFFVEEALHRLVEINYKIGLIEESEKFAKLLGYNYQSSEWYKKSYKVFNKDYKEINIKRTNRNKTGVIEKFKNLFD